MNQMAWSPVGNMLEQLPLDPLITIIETYVAAQQPRAVIALGASSHALRTFVWQTHSLWVRMARMANVEAPTRDEWLSLNQSDKWRWFVENIATGLCAACRIAWAEPYRYWQGSSYTKWSTRSKVACDLCKPLFRQIPRSYARSDYNIPDDLLESFVPCEFTMNPNGFEDSFSPMRLYYARDLMAVGEDIYGSRSAHETARKDEVARRVMLKEWRKRAEEEEKQYLATRRQGKDPIEKLKIRVFAPMVTLPRLQLVERATEWDMRKVGVPIRLCKRAAAIVNAAKEGREEAEENGTDPDVAVALMVSEGVMRPNRKRKAVDGTEAATKEEEGESGEKGESVAGAAVVVDSPASTCRSVRQRRKADADISAVPSTENVVANVTPAAAVETIGISTGRTRSARKR